MYVCVSFYQKKSPTIIHFGKINEYRYDDIPGEAEENCYKKGNQKAKAKGFSLMNCFQKFARKVYIGEKPTINLIFFSLH